MMRKEILKTKPNDRGFTIVELMIATSVFSVMLLLATAGMIQIGKTYHKGIVTSRTQEATRSLVDDISRSIQLGANNIVTNPTGPGLNGEFAQCVGSVRYTYLLNRRLDPPANPHVLWVDIISGVNCPPLDLNAATPQDASTDLSASASLRRELLDRNMRLVAFNLSDHPSSNSLINVRAKIIHGEDEVIDGRGTPETVDDTCLSTRDGGQFCALSELDTFVKKRL